MSNIVHQRPKTADLLASRQTQSAMNRQPLFKPLTKKREDDPLRQSFTEEKDQRLKYLLKFAKIISHQDDYASVFAELPQIPGVWIFYRKDAIRSKHPEV